MVKIKKQLIASRSYTSGSGNAKKYITVHQTANTSKGANAQAHANLQSNGNSRNASWHYTVDDTQAIQSFSHDVKCWHAGTTAGNHQSIGVELCVNSDANYKKVLENGAELVKSIMKQEGISIGNVVQHNHWSGKNCPTQLRAGYSGINWVGFINMVQGKKGTTTTSSSGGSSGGSSYTSVASKWTGQNLKKWHKGGAVKQLQKLVGVKADGYFGADTVNAVKKAQKKHGLAVDGIAGKDTDKALTGRKSSKKKAKLKVEGYIGKSSIKATQKATGSKYTDGVFSNQPNNAQVRSLEKNAYTLGSKGSQSVGALQKKVGASLHNKLGPETVRKLQNKMNTPVDGKISRPSPMVKELQRRLNNGTF